MQLFKGMDVVSCLEEVINPRRRVEVVHIKCSLSQPPYLERGYWQVSVCAVFRAIVSDIL